MKTLKIKFTRKPQYTPATLTAAELTRIERLVKLSFGRTHKPGIVENGFSQFERGEEFDRIAFWRSSSLRNSTHPRGMIGAQMTTILVSREDAERYFVTCYRYLLAVAKNNGEVCEYRKSAGKYAMAAGYYG